MPAPKNNIEENKPQMSLIPLDILAEFLVPAYMEGLEKYSRESWRLGFKVTTMMDALQRHLTAFFYDGEDFDTDAEKFNVKKHHLGGALFSLLCMCDTVANHPELDDRHKKVTVSPEMSEELEKALTMTLHNIQEHLKTTTPLDEIARKKENIKRRRKDDN